MKAATGQTLDVGAFPPVADTGGQSDDPELIPRLTAHIVARIADRFPPARKLSRHLEGKDRRAGLLSDLFAAVVALYKRNPDVMETLTRQVAEEFGKRQRDRAAAQASGNGGVKRRRRSSQQQTEESNHAAS